MRDERFRRFRPFRDFARSRKAETALAARFFSRFRREVEVSGRAHPGASPATPLWRARKCDAPHWGPFFSRFRDPVFDENAISKSPRPEFRRGAKLWPTPWGIRLYGISEDPDTSNNLEISKMSKRGREKHGRPGRPGSDQRGDT